MNTANQKQSKKGVIVPLERQADIIIADDLRARFAPSGALSWKYIIESVDAGRKKSRTLYMINGSEKALGPAQSKAGTSAKKKADTPKGPKRVAYTEEDDRALRLHVARRVIKGEAPLGNSLYMDFFEIVSRNIAKLSSTD